MLFRSGPRASGVTDFHDVTGGVYKARERIHRSNADLRLLATPTSQCRVADTDQKHKAATVGELLDIQSDFEQKINLIDNFDEEIARLQRETADVESRLSEVIYLGCGLDKRIYIPSTCRYIVRNVLFYIYRQPSKLSFPR